MERWQPAFVIAVATLGMVAQPVRALDSSSFDAGKVAAQTSHESVSVNLLEAGIPADGAAPAAGSNASPTLGLAATESSGDSPASPKTTPSKNSPLTQDTKEDPNSLRGHLVETVDSPKKIIDDIVQSAIIADEQSDYLNGKVKKYNTTFHRTLHKGKDLANFMTSYKGFERSSEAADIILDEKLKVKSKASAAYARQRKSDEYSSRAFSIMMEMAQGLGEANPALREKSLSASMKELITLVGEEQSAKIFDRMKTWASTVSPDEASFEQSPISALESDGRIKLAVDAALTDDDVVKEIRTRLHKYNQRSKVMRVTAKVVNTTLSIAMFSPNIISPAAQVAYLAFCMATGGPEEAKLLQELYLDQRFHSRWKLYDHNAGLAVTGYNTALLTKNAILLEFAENSLKGMVAPPLVDSADSISANASGTKAAPARPIPPPENDVDKSAATGKAPVPNAARKDSVTIAL